MFFYNSFIVTCFLVFFLKQGFRDLSRMVGLDLVEAIVLPARRWSQGQAELNDEALRWHGEKR